MFDKNKIIEEATYFLTNKSTIRKTAKYFAVSKSLIHVHFNKLLPKINFELFVNVKNLLNYNFADKHNRGGNATKNKYFSNKSK